MCDASSTRIACIFLVLFSHARQTTEREASEDFRGLNNFENYLLPVIEDALVRGWDDANSEEGKRR